MNELIGNVLQWGIDKGITGTYGKGTCYGQADKVLEEANETEHNKQNETRTTKNSHCGSVWVD
jgi:hypothetical protein